MTGTEVDLLKWPEKSEDYNKPIEGYVTVSGRTVEVNFGEKQRTIFANFRFKNHVPKEWKFDNTLIKVCLVARSEDWGKGLSADIVWFEADGKKIIVYEVKESKASESDKKDVKE